MSELRNELIGFVYLLALLAALGCVILIGRGVRRFREIALKQSGPIELWQKLIIDYKNTAEIAVPLLSFFGFGALFYFFADLITGRH